jgi:predicted nucleic acid-binding protein
VRKCALVRPDLKLVRKTDEISAKETISIYDAFFVTLALETGLELKSLDRAMIKTFDDYRRKTC